MAWGDVVTSGEVAALVVAALVLVALGLLVFIYVRRRTLSHGQPLMVGAVRYEPEGAWTEVLVRLDHDALALFPLGGISLRPRCSLARLGLDVAAPRPVDGPVPSPLGHRDAVEVECVEAGKAPVRLALAKGDYMALRSWQESAPPALGHPSVI